MPVYHLKHRPKKISELDLVEVRERLTAILKEKERPQSFLFAGPKGAGKTSAARAMARSVNCLAPKGVDSCNQCANCKEILAGSSIDLIEIDGASNRGIDDVRLLRERAYLTASKLKVKVFIIDEVHMLTREAFNALLKLLEEPPKNTLFILCTTEPGKVPETILSRLIRVDFTKGQDKELRSSLERVIKGEKIKIDSQAIELLVAQSDGSFRNLHKLFGELVMEVGKKISKKQVEEFLARKVGDYEGRQVEADLAKSKTEKILAKLEALAKKGSDFASLRQSWISYFASRMLADFGLTEERGELGAEEVRRFLDLLIEAGKREREVEIAQLPLELAVVEFLASREMRVQKEEERQKEIEKQQAAGTEKKTTDGVKLEEIEARWAEVLSAVKPFNHSVEAFMRSSRPGKVEGRVLTLEVFYPFHKERLDEEKNRKIVEEGLRRVFGKDLLLKCVLAKGKKKMVVNKGRMAEETGEKDLYDVAKEIFG